jgi:hypothetical protein
MKNLLYLVFASILISACNFNHSESLDSVTGMSTKGDGLSSDEPFIEIEGVTVNRNSFSYGEKVWIMFNNVQGLERNNDRAHVGLSIKITNTLTNKVEVEEDDLFADRADGFEETPLLVKANFLAAFPYKDNEKYKIDVRIWDKDGTGEFTMSMPFTIHESELINVKSKQIEYSSVYLWNETKQIALVDNKIDMSDKLLIIFDGLKGFSEEGGSVYPTVSLELIDDAGTVIISEDNLLSDVVQSGVGPEELAGQLPLSVAFGRKIKSPAHLKVIIADQISNERLILVSDLEVMR